MLKIAKIEENILLAASYEDVAHIVNSNMLLEKEFVKYIINRATSDFVNGEIRSKTFFDDFLDVEVTAIQENNKYKEEARRVNAWVYSIWNIVDAKIKEIDAFDEEFIEFDIRSFIDSLPKLEENNGG